MNRMTIFALTTLAALLLPSLAAAQSSEPYQASGAGSGTAAACRDPLVLDLGGCDSYETQATLAGSPPTCVPDDQTLQWFECTVDWTLTHTDSGADSGCSEALSSVVAYDLGCTEVFIAPYKNTQTGEKTYHVPWGASTIHEWVQACVDIATPKQRCSDPQDVPYAFSIQSPNAAVSPFQEVDQIVGIVNDLINNPPSPPSLG